MGYDWDENSGASKWGDTSAAGGSWGDSKNWNSKDGGNNGWTKDEKWDWNKENEWNYNKEHDNWNNEKGDDNWNNNNWNNNKSKDNNDDWGRKDNEYDNNDHNNGSNKTVPEGKESWWTQELLDEHKKATDLKNMEWDQDADDDTEVVNNDTIFVISNPKTQNNEEIRDPLSPDHLERFQTWDECGTTFPKELIDMLKAEFPKPSLIQQYTWPILMNEEDFIGVAQTGSGKTLAFLMPLFVSIKVAEMFPAEGTTPFNEDQRSAPMAIILTPTRELAIQIQAECDRFGAALNIRSKVCVGGNGKKKEDIQDLQENNYHILCGSPGRIADMCNDVEISKLEFDRVKFFVLDEADVMLEQGFEWDVRSVIDVIPDDRQSFLFTATFPKVLQSLCKQVVYRDCYHIQIGTNKGLTGNTDIVQEVRHCKDEDAKSNEIWNIVEMHESQCENTKYLVFCATKKKCDDMVTKFKQYGKEPVALHGGLEQKDREWNLQSFKDGYANMMFGTDVASRGLDIKGDEIVVINFDCADSQDTHTHRIGRTGRAGKSGKAYTFLTPDDGWFAPAVVETMKRCGQMPDEELAQLARDNKNHKWAS